MRFKMLERGPTLPEEVVASISRAIAIGELQPGDRLPAEQALAADFGVARTVVREAISQLKYDGVIQSRKGIGAFIGKPEERTAFRISPQCFEKRKELLKLMRIRTGVAVEAAAEAALNRTGKDVQAMEEIVSEMRRALDDAVNGAERHFEAERGLVSAIGIASRNEHALALIAMIDRQIADNLRSVAVKNTKAAELAASIVGDYERIVAAISSRDADRAMDETRQHYESASRRLADRADLADV